MLPAMVSLITKLVPAVLNSNRWVQVWGSPLTVLSHDFFHRIGDYCGRLVAVDSETKSKSVISYARIKVEADSLNCIPRHMILSIGDEDFNLLLEVEMGLGMEGAIPAVGTGEKPGPKEEVSGRKGGPLDPKIFPQPSDTKGRRVTLLVDGATKEEKRTHLKGKAVLDTCIHHITTGDSGGHVTSSSEPLSSKGQKKSLSTHESSWVWKPNTAWA